MVPDSLQFGWLVYFVSLGAIAPAQTVDYSRDVRPILSDRCFACHGPDQNQREADLRLDDLSDALELLAPGRPDDSELLRRLTTRDRSERMPPPAAKLEISAAEIEVIRRWIEQGAAWQKHWSLIPPVEHAVPPMPESWQAELGRLAPPPNGIDHFIAVRLNNAEMQFSPLSPPEKLLRRLTFDLTGLSPTLDELDAFLTDQGPDAYERAIDRLLASPRYGERMASWWLDLARYSDTYGYQVDRDRFVWPWRDWVIRAFNENMPFDQFTIEQIAGDLLPQATDEQILATTFNRLHPQKVEGGSVEEEFRVEYVADRVHTLGMAFMGLTLECARCHDHKFDPLTMEDYYQMFAFFNNVDESGLYSFFDAAAVPTPTLALPTESQREQLAQLQENVQHAERTWHDLAKLPTVAIDHVEFQAWLQNIELRKSLAPAPVCEPIYELDVAAISVGDNRRVDGELTSQVVLEFTGDDEIALPAGRFAREQPFTITTQIWIPPQPEGRTIERNVIFHCSRAWTDSASRGYQLLVEDGRLSASLIHFWPGNAVSVRTESPLLTGQWLQIAVAYDGSSTAAGLNIYIDGRRQTVEIVRDKLDRTILGEGTDRLTLGARFRDRGFTGGRLSALQIFDRNLTELEIAQLANDRRLTELLSMSVAELRAAQVDDLFAYYLANCDSTARQTLADVQQYRAAYNEFNDRIPEIMVMREVPGLRATFVLNRGAYDSPTKPVQPRVPAMLPTLSITESRELNRLDLARWMVDGNHPLTARVIVNQLWQLVMGAGLVRTPEDFGHQSEPPTHPELLDWLAADFQTDWDVKRCLKQLVMSLTYRQGTCTPSETWQRDPNNRLWSRASARRLTAEMLRDNALWQSELLVERLGGPPVRPYDLELAFTPMARSGGEGLYRRSVYTYWKRTATSPAMIVLDGPTRDVCQVKRERTTSPLQALVMLNGTQFVEAARKLSERFLVAHANEPTKIVRDLFRSLTSRMPDDAESEILRRLFETERERFNADNDSADQLLSVGESPVRMEQRPELAAWTTVALTIMNFDEAVTNR